MALFGEVSSMGLEEVLGFLKVNGLRGVLSVRGGAAGAVALRLHFDDGRIFMPYSDRRAIRDLKRVISPDGRVAKAWEHLLRELKTRSDRLQRGRLRLQGEAEVPGEDDGEIFRWEEARFEFVQAELPEDVRADIRSGRCLEIEPNELLMDAAKRSDEGARLRRFLPSDRLVLSPAGEAPSLPGLTLEVVEWEAAPRVMDLLRGIQGDRHEVVAELARGLERGVLRAVEPEEALAQAQALLDAGALGGALHLLAHLCELEEYAPSRAAVSLVRAIARSESFGRSETASVTMRMDGPRAFGLLIQLVSAQERFSLQLGEGESAKRIARDEAGLRIEGGESELPALEVYLARLGHLTTRQYKKITRSHSRKQLEEHVGSKELEEARLERLVEELAEVFFLPASEVQLSNAAPGPAAEGARSAPADPRTLRRVRAGLKHWVGVLGTVRGEAAVFVKGPRYKASDPAGRFFSFFSPRRTLGQLRRLAGTDPLQFVQLVAQGLQAGYLRRPSLSELQAGVDAARGAGNHPLVYALARAGVVFGHTTAFVPLLEEYRDRELVPRTQASFHGDLEGVGLPPILQILHEGRRTGTLTVYAEGFEERLHFFEGEAYCVDVEDFGSKGLAELFRGEGAAVASATRSDERRELRERFLEVIFWQDATFAFQQNSLPDEFFREAEGITKLAIDTRRFLLEAVRTMSRWDAISDHFPQGVKTIFRFRDGEDPLRAVRDQGESRALTLIDGRLTFEELVRLSGESSLAAGTAIARLVEEQAVEPLGVSVGGSK